MTIILGSASPRRKEILGYFDLPFQQISSDFNEDSIPFNGNPSEYTLAIAKGKKNAFLTQFHDRLVLTADTVVYKNGKIYGKPRDDREAQEFLRELSGDWHSVYTGLNVSLGEKEFEEVTETRVLFNNLNGQQIRSYNQKLHYLDKAGGYMIQQAGSIIVNRIEGCYYNVMGLPVNSLRKLLLNFEIDLWDRLLQKNDEMI